MNVDEARAQLGLFRLNHSLYEDRWGWTYLSPQSSNPYKLLSLNTRVNPFDHFVPICGLEGELSKINPSPNLLQSKWRKERFIQTRQRAHIWNFPSNASWHPVKRFPFWKLIYKTLNPDYKGRKAILIAWFYNTRAMVSNRPSTEWQGKDESQKKKKKKKKDRVKKIAQDP